MTTAYTRASRAKASAPPPVAKPKPLLAEGAKHKSQLREFQRLAGDAVMSTHERAERLFEYAADGFYLHDLTGRFVDGNRAAEELSGYPREELIGKNMLELNLLDEADRARAAADLARLAQGQVTGPDAYTLHRKNGTRVTVEIRSYPIEMNGETLVLGVARDITDRQLAEQELRASEEQLRAVWEHSIDGMRLTDHRGRIIAVNEAYCRLVKLPRERLLGQVFSVTYAEKGIEGRLDDYLKRFDSGKIIPRRTTRAQLWNGEDLDLDITSSFVEMGQRGRLVLTIFRDITERRQAERVGAAFLNLGQQLSAAQTAEAAAQIIVDIADQLLGWDSCNCDLYSPETDLLTHLLTLDIINGKRTKCVPEVAIQKPTGLGRRTLERGGQLILRDAQSRFQPGDLPFGDTSRRSASILYVPIRNGTEITGLLTIQSYSLQAYNDASLKTFQALADVCGGALNRIRAQEVLEATQNRLAHFLAESPAVIYSLKHVGTTFVPAWYSHYLQELLGFSPEAACRPEWWPQQVHPSDRGTMQEWLTAILKHKRLTRVYRMRHKNGQYRWLHDEQRLVCDSHGEPMEVVGSWVDVTEHKALEEAQRRLAIAVEQAAESILITDVTGTIQYVNPAFEQVTGYTRHEALGQNPRLLKSSKHDAAFYQQMWQTLAAGNSWHGRLINKRKDGTLLEEDATITPMRDPGGKITNFVAVKHDVTRQVQLETQLRQAQKMEAIGQLAGGVAHDFNNLLLVMRGNAELLQLDEDTLSEPVKESLRQITAAAERAGNLTRQLLAFGRKQVMQAEPLILDEVIVNLAKMLKRLIGEHINLRCHYSAGLPYLEADAGMMEQVLVNLVVNARDAMPHGGDLDISTERALLRDSDLHINSEGRAGEFVCLSVRDNGTGIAPEHLPRLFEPFFTTKQAGKGTGLGLATVYGIVKQHQGWIEVDSRPGAGSTFRIYLPTVPPPASKAAAAQAESARRGGTESILLVEDEAAVRRITRRILESAGYKIYEAPRAKEAFDLFAEHREEIALLLTDIVMPDGVNGRELAADLHDQKPALKVLLMSGYSGESAGNTTRFLQKTGAHFLQKPCTARDLLETVRRTLDEKVPG